MLVKDIFSGLYKVADSINDSKVNLKYVLLLVVLFLVGIFNIQNSYKKEIKLYKNTINEIKFSAHEKEIKNIIEELEEEMKAKKEYEEEQLAEEENSKQFEL